MKIFPIITTYKQNVYQKNTTFGVNLASPKLTYELEDFFVNIKGYGKDMHWANRVKRTANQAVIMIRNNTHFEDIIHQIAWGVRCANQYTGEAEKAKLTGVLRDYRPSWDNQFRQAKDSELYTPYGRLGFNKYELYEKKLDNTINKPLNNPYPKMSLSRAILSQKSNSPCNYILHGNAENVNVALNYVESIYNKLQKNYVNKNIKNKDLNHINNLIARSRWILAHSTPWCRGSDSISNIYIRSLYKAMGIKSFQLVQNISLDLEAYCTPIEEYMKNFTTYFVKAPEIVK